MKVDVLVAGGGPAGAIAALQLARAGVRVTVVDRAQFPRDKLCGDSVNPGTLRLLHRLGVAHAADSGLPLEGMIVTGSGGVRVEARYGGNVFGRALMRRALDAALLEAAVQAGAEVQHGAIVRRALLDADSRTSRVSGLEIAGADGGARRVLARVVIAADGRHSRVARGLGLAAYPARPRRWAIGCYFENVAGLTRCGEMHVRPGHYVGVAPLAGGIANVCLVLEQPRSLSRPGDLLKSHLASDAQLAHRFTRARMIGRPVVLGPLAVECDVPGAPGLLLAGDAAGFIDPMTGDGLRFAIRGAELAAIEALRALERGTDDAHVRLRAARRREFSRKWRFNRTLRWMVDVPVALNAAARGAAVAPGWLRQAVRYAGDVRAA